MCRPELRLDDLLADPLIRLVMASDAVEEADIRRLVRQGAVPDRRRTAPERDARCES